MLLLQISDFIVVFFNPNSLFYEKVIVLCTQSASFRVYESYGTDNDTYTHTYTHTHRL